MPSSTSDVNLEWMGLMRRGDFAHAWELSARLLRERAGVSCAHLPRQYQSIWDGRPLDGQRVLIRCYHGLGDTIQFIRYAPLVKARAREVVVWAQPPLLPLLRTAAGVDRLIPLHDGSPDVAYDVDVEVMELPFVFRTTVDTIPGRVPYLEADHAAPRRADGPAVGLVWKAGDWARERSIPFELLATITSQPATWYVLQGEPGLRERPPGFGTVRGTDSLTELAATIRQLDLVITIDSMPAHLAGALAAPVWTLLRRDADWRWMEARQDTPWYPTMRLFRQERDGDWEGVIAAVAGELSAFLAERGATGA